MFPFRRASGLLAALTCALAAGAGLPRLTVDQLRAVQSAEPQRARQALRFASDAKARLGLGQEEDFTLLAPFTDTYGQTHVRLQHTLRGIPVWGSQSIVKVDGQGALDTSVADLRLAKASAFETPSRGAYAFAPEKAFAAVLAHLGPAIEKAELLSAPSLVWFPAQDGFRLASRTTPDGRTVVDPDFTFYFKSPARGALFQGYHVSLQWEREGQVRRGDFVVDASSGEVRAKWNNLQAADADGNSYYNGPVRLQTDLNSATGLYALRDLARPSRPHPRTGYLGNAVIDWANASYPTSLSSWTSSMMSKIYTDADNTWGDGRPYDITQATLPATSGENGQTTAVDAHFGVQATWDMFAQVFGRNGLDNQGTSTLSIVHCKNGSSTLVNAYWQPETFTMIYGDGSVYSQVWSLTSPEIIAHELTHGVTQFSAGLVYSGESGGLNEATSDIFGKLLEFYAAKGATGNRIPECGELPVSHPSLKWQVGNRISMRDTDPPLRYMMKPSLDGTSPDYWTPVIQELDVHYNSGPMNRAFYFLSQGASSRQGDLNHSGALPGGMAGIGNQKAGEIYYRALTTRFTAGTSYAGARAHCLAVAEELFGAGSAESLAVQNAFAAISVGPAAGKAPGSEIRFQVFGPAQSEIHNPTWYPAKADIQYLMASGYSLQLRAEGRNLPSSGAVWSMAPGVQGEAVGRVDSATGVFKSSGPDYWGWVRGTSLHDSDLMDQVYVCPVIMDFNGDLEVDGEDVGLFALAYNTQVTPTANYPSNYSKDVDFLQRGLIDNATGLFLLDIFKTTLFK